MNSEEPSNWLQKCQKSIYAPRSVHANVTKVPLAPNTYIREAVSASDWEEIQNLATRSQRGEKESYRKFLGLVGSRLKPRLLRVLPASYADDALQEILMAIHKALHTFDSKKPISPWLNAIAHYKVQDQLRIIYRSSDAEELVETQVSSSSPSPDYLVGRDLERVLGKLPTRERRILMLLKVEEFSVDEVAEKMGMTASNVKVTSFRALNKLRELLSEEEFYERK